MTDASKETPGGARQGSSRASAVSHLTLNRLSFYLRCLRSLQAEDIERISSKELARRYHLSASQIRKDLAQFGEFGIRGVGYDVAQLIDHLSDLLGLERLHRMIIVGMGNLGSALACFFGFNSGAFRVVAGVDRDPSKVGTSLCGFTVGHTDDLAAEIRRSRAEIGILCVPADAAQSTYDELVAAGIRGVLNFSPIRLRPVEGVVHKDVDLRINLEELAFFLKEPAAEE